MSRLKSMKKQFICPRCGSKKTIEYEDSFECLECNLEFNKVKDKDIDDDNVLAIDEVKGIVDELGGSKYDNNVKKLKKTLKDDKQ